jgi:membrane associated rhomboid family serine protease
MPAMETVATFADEDAARAFAAYLDESQGLAAEVAVDGRGWTVAVGDPARAATARLLAERFPGAALMADERAPPRRAAWLTMAMAVAVLVVAGLSEVGDGGFAARLVMEGFTREWWRIATPVLLHVGFIHLLGNLSWWSMLATQVERREGPLRLALLLALATVLPNAGQYLASGGNFGGLSGVVYALIGYVALRTWRQPALGYAFGRWWQALALAWLPLCLTGWLGPIANTAHALGLGVGAALALLPPAGIRRR